METIIKSEIIWLFAGLLMCAMMIFGCACCSLRFTRIQQRKRMELETAEGVEHGLKTSTASFNGGPLGADSFGGMSMSFAGPDMSCEFDNSMDMASSSVK